MDQVESGQGAAAATAQAGRAVVEMVLAASGVAEVEVRALEVGGTVAAEEKGWLVAAPLGAATQVVVLVGAVAAVVHKEAALEAD